jgi:hypothetical protein
MIASAAVVGSEPSTGTSGTSRSEGLPVTSATSMAEAEEQHRHNSETGASAKWSAVVAYQESSPIRSGDIAPSSPSGSGSRNNGTAVTGELDEWLQLVSDSGARVPRDTHTPADPAAAAATSWWKSSKSIDPPTPVTAHVGVASFLRARWCGNGGASDEDRASGDGQKESFNPQLSKKITAVFVLLFLLCCGGGFAIHEIGVSYSSNSLQREFESECFSTTAQFRNGRCSVVSSSSLRICHCYFLSNDGYSSFLY